MEQNQQLKLINNQLDISIKNCSNTLERILEQECKTNVLGEGYSRLNNIIILRDGLINKLQDYLKEFDQFEQKELELGRILRFIVNKGRRDKSIKQQNESLLNDLSGQTNNYRSLASQHKQLQKFAENAKLNSITMNKFMSKCKPQEREVE